MASPSPLRRVCVTGGGGFIASWLVKLLLSRGYSVHATLRDPGKTAAEETVWEYAEKRGPNAMKNFMWHIVDVRDVADALVLVYEKPESSGRYICGGDNISTKDMVELLKKNYPTYNYVNCNIDIDLQFAPISSEKLRSLGWKPRELEETLLDSADCYEKEGILQDVVGRPSCAYLPLVDRPTSTTPPVGDEGCKPAGIPWFVDMASSPPPRVCVTGGGGFVASWLIKLLLSRGYAVHATVSDPYF
ncbi:hypothetical protein PR202_ga15418 [Eleusine coracana subsp. coracana]|uniref:NAD(P)-binding domain-containing protein n=1 Tax=Eleusine coracana subsp. coracana TaxID=191504 RepID=A0AAV5CIZ8_ELECO|nr:hypothetical protein PR202_ga15418 [Eleusine coracana subsp. coracana]